jgi:integrase
MPAKQAKVTARFQRKSGGVIIYETQQTLPNKTAAKQWQKDMETGYDWVVGELAKELAHDTDAVRRQALKDCMTLVKQKVKPEAALEQVVSELAGGGVSVEAALLAQQDRIESGALKDRNGREYKPATKRRYRIAVESHLVPALGGVRVSALDRKRCKALVERWDQAGMSASSIRNNLDPLRVLCRELLEDGVLEVNPLTKVKLPAAESKARRAATPAEAAALLAALPDSDRPLWTCAFYAGLRRGELRALQVQDIDFSAGVIHVCRGWDQEEGEQGPKTFAGTRDVPMTTLVAKTLAGHVLELNRDGADLVFGRTASLPFTISAVANRARRAWGWKLCRVKGAPRNAPREWVATEGALEPIGLHEARHTFVSYAVAAGLDLKELVEVVGHSDIRTTLNIYAHLFADSHPKIAGKLDAYLGQTETHA